MPNTSPNPTEALPTNAHSLRAANQQKLDHSQAVLPGPSKETTRKSEGGTRGYDHSTHIQEHLRLAQSNLSYAIRPAKGTTPVHATRAVSHFPRGRNLIPSPGVNPRVDNHQNPRNPPPTPRTKILDRHPTWHVLPPTYLRPSNKRDQRRLKHRAAEETERQVGMHGRHLSRHPRPIPNRRVSLGDQKDQTTSDEKACPSVQNLSPTRPREPEFPPTWTHARSNPPTPSRKTLTV